MAPDKYRYIVVEGPIGAGKTSLARRLASLLGKTLMLEDPDSNPFLARFYDGARDPGKPQKHPESPPRMEMKWK